MATLNRTTTAWASTVAQTKIDSTYNFAVGGTYTDRDINLNVDASHINLENGQTFYLNDTLYSWTWQVDAQGNVTIF